MNATASQSKTRQGKASPPPIGTASISYLDGLVAVNFIRLSTLFAPLFKDADMDNTESHLKVVRALEDGSAANSAWQIYQSCDKRQNGYLDWESNEIQRFIKALFHENGFGLPSEEQMYRLYMTFDVDSSLRLSARACICLADAALRALLHARHLGTNSRRGNEPPRRPARSDATEELRAVGGAMDKDLARQRSQTISGVARVSESSAAPAASPRKVSFGSHEDLLLELSEPTEPSSEQSPISLVTPAESSSPDTSGEQAPPRDAAPADDIGGASTAAEMRPVDTFRELRRMRAKTTGSPGYDDTSSPDTSRLQAPPRDAAPADVIGGASTAAEIKPADAFRKTLELRRMRAKTTGSPELPDT